MFAIVIKIRCIALMHIFTFVFLKCPHIAYFFQTAKEVTEPAGMLILDLKSAKMHALYVVTQSQHM